jgi:cell division septation protein DedD
MEKKQAVLLVALVLVISVVSFVLGVVVGRNTGEPEVVQQILEPQRIVVDEKLATPAEVEPSPVSPVNEKLTFYENLSKEEMAPIGSGINLPPVVEPAQGADEIKAPTAVAKAEVIPQILSSTTQVSPPVPAPGKSADVDKLPPTTKGGAWVVQVFSSKSAADAGVLRDKLGGKGYPAFITEADLGKKGIWYRVFLGPYADKEVAAQAQAYAGAKDKLSGFVKRR